MTVSVFASFYPKPESQDAFLALMAGMVRDTRDEPGCLRYDLFSGVGEDGGYHLFEIYADAGALDAHRAAAYFKAYRAAAPDLLAEPIGVLVLEPVDAQS